MGCVKFLNDLKSMLESLMSLVARNRFPTVEKDTEIGVEDSKTFLQASRRNLSPKRCPTMPFQRNNVWVRLRKELLSNADISNAGLNDSTTQSVGSVVLLKRETLTRLTHKP